MPRRSASTRLSATMLASRFGTPAAPRMAEARAVRRSTLIPVCSGISAPHGLIRVIDRGQVTRISVGLPVEVTQAAGHRADRATAHRLPVERDDRHDAARGRGGEELAGAS